ncbi:unnamed protein product [Soboliphyme baturini]|uniref:PI31_Prot_N domain-containing protein n=1 Tax=Soboliphyme baturini TaxID=241478 RepID=A0A183IGV4_9BILA|nr:unnamed protein product [Soboliphyme baturini]
MKLNLKFRGQRHSITVENSVDLVTLMAMAVEAFHLEGRFYLSLNGVDKISRDLDVVTIDTLGLVNGDTIYVLECPCETAAVCSAESNLHANAALASVLKSLNLTSNSEVLCATIHHLLIENGFKNVGEGEGLPADWRQLSGVGFFRLLYENQISSVIVELTITIHGKDTDNEVAYVRASFDVGIEKDNVEVPVALTQQLGTFSQGSDNNIQDPDHAQFPGIGGPADLNPLYPFRPPRLPQNFPAAPRQPFGPRFDPLYPDAPGLIDIPRPGRPRRRPNPDGYDPPFGFL